MEVDPTSIMRDTIILKNRGGTITFIIQNQIIEFFDLHTEDIIEVEIFINESSYVINRAIRTVGTSLGVSLRKSFCETLDLKDGQLLQVDIRRPDEIIS